MILETFKSITIDLKKQLMSSDILLSDCVLDQNIKKSFIFNDSTFFPFYYYLGKYTKAENLLVLGVESGFTTSCFLKSNKVKKAVCFQESNDEFYSVRGCYSNIAKQQPNAKIFCGNLLDEEILKEITSQKWDCILFNLDLNYDKLRNYLDIAWNNLVLDGVMVIESELSSHTNRATQDFLKVVQRDYLVFDTRYKAIVVTK
jgi:phospholipid N-methyltransferase